MHYRHGSLWVMKSVSRPFMRSVAVKDERQQTQAMMFRTCEMFVKQRTHLIDWIRAHLTEYGIVLPEQRGNGRLFAKRCRSKFDNAPETATLMIEIYLKQIEAIDVSRVTAFLRSTRTQFVWISLSKVLLFHNLVYLLLVSGKEGLAQGMFLYKISQECCD